ncbi:MAG: hypothetical protein V4857_09995 [Pseudomonadota bacterium]
MKIVATFNIKDPASDARMNIANGDKRLIGICGYSCAVPGRDGDALRPLVKRFGLRVLEGTSCVIEGPEHATLHSLAVGYGIAYNVELAKILASVSQEVSDDSSK